jgi:uncharacterized protein (TIGR00369 family)
MKDEPVIRKIRNPFRLYKGEAYNCFGCSPNNPVGLQLDFYSDGENLFANWQPTRQYEGYTNVIHGGVQATLMDEIASWFVYSMLDTAGVTSSLEVHYHKPLYVNGGEVKIVAMLKEHTDKKAVLQTEILNAKGLICSSAVVEYYLFPSAVAKAKYLYPGKKKFWE